MGCSYYNGTMLPNLPQTPYPYALILESNGQPVLWLSSEPFRVSSRFSKSFYIWIDGDIAAYAANMTNYKWEQGTVESSGTGYSGINGNYVWSNHNVCLYNIDPEIMPEWDSVTYPYLLMRTRSHIENVTQIAIYEAWHSTAPFAMNDAVSTEGQALTTEVIGPTFSHTTDTIGHHTMRLAGSSAVPSWSTNADITSTDHSLGSACFNADSPAFNLNYWANHDIVGSVRGKELKANNWYELVCYAAAETEAVIVEAPTDVAITGGGTYNQGETADALVCTATAPEGGTLSYKWYKDGSYVSSSNTYTPSTETAGVFEYYVIVTNTQYGDTASVQSATVTVTVNAVETEDTEQETIAKRVKEHIIGYVLRLCGVPMAELVAEMLCKETRVPVAYSYNGIVAPKMPVWNEEEFPFVTMTWNSTLSSFRALYFSKEQPRLHEGSAAVVWKIPTPYMTSRIDGGQWSAPTLSDASEEYSTQFTKWTNYDCIKADGTVHLAASDPVPVYE